MLYPCKNCKHRHLGCHAECKEYQAAVDAGKLRKKADAPKKWLDGMEAIRSLRIKTYLHKKKRN